MTRTGSFTWRALSVACTVASIVGAQVTEVASVSTSGEFPNIGGAGQPVISADGRYVAFFSAADNLVPYPDTPGFTNDVFVHERERDVTVRISIPSPGNGSIAPRLSGDGRFVTYTSYSNNQGPIDTNGRIDVYLHDQQTLVTTLVSVDSNGVQGNGDSYSSDISDDGQVIAFDSVASNLAPGDTNGVYDAFVRYVQSGHTARISVDSLGNQGNGESGTPAISADGRFVAFQSVATNLVANDTNGARDVFVRDLVGGTTARVSVSSSGLEGTLASQLPALSGDGRFVAFRSAAVNLVPNDTNGFDDIFVHDRQTGSTVRANLSSHGVEADGPTGHAPSLSADGRYVCFQSIASNLVPNDANGGGGAGNDVFVRDLLAGTTRLVSVNSLGIQGNSFSGGPLGISGGGNVVVFVSNATNLVPGDMDGSTDVFVREMCAVANAFNADADGDGYGDSNVTASGCSQPPGYVADDTDCDDADANVHPGAIELCNSVDDDCDGAIDEGFAPTSYCTPSTTVQNCSPHMSASGIPSATSAAGFTLVVTDVDGERTGTIFFGLSTATIPWAPGSTSTLCVQPPVVRTGLLNSGGDHERCDGVFALDWNAWRAARTPGVYSAGQALYAQCWFRNSPAPAGSNLSDALRFTVCD